MVKWFLDIINLKATNEGTKYLLYVNHGAFSREEQVMEQKEAMELVGKLITDNPAKFIKIRGCLDEIFAGRTLESSKAISDREFEKIRDKFREIDVPLVWCVNKDAVYQLQKAVRYHREQSRRREDYTTGKKSSKSNKKGLFGIFGQKK